jgi:membrane protease YdiL (CAAX protease family)
MAAAAPNPSAKPPEKSDKPAPPPPVLGNESNSTLLWGMIRKRPKPLLSIAFTVPLFLLYQLGILVLDRTHDVDFLSTAMLRLLDASQPIYVLVTLALTLVLLMTTWVQQKRGKVDAHSMGRVLAESLGSALVMLLSIGWATHEVRTGESLNITPLGFLDKIILSAGAGFHEELIFRALLITGGTRALAKLTKWKPKVSMTLCLVVSSLLFSLAHYFVLFDDVFVPKVAGFRVLEGLLFGLLYLSRGFAVAVYAHAFYDLMAFYLYA